MILAIAWLAGRPLGVSRSWAGTVLAGVAGWLAALALSLAIAQGDTGAPGFAHNLWVFAAVFTMSASVWVELPAKPGALARAQTGLVSVPCRCGPSGAPAAGCRATPRPPASPSSTASGRCTGSASRPATTWPSRPPRPPGACARPSRSAAACSSSSASTRADLLPAGVVAELSRLQDRVAPAPPDAVRALLEAELGRPGAEVFAELDPEPIAAASIAQAYRGRLRSGEAVVVQVQRPGIAESVDRDLLVLAELARVAETRTAWGADYHVTDLASEFADRLREELDFRLEARNATEIAAALIPADGVHVPAVHAELSTARILVMEWLEGGSVREVERIDALGLDRSRLAEALRASLRQMLVDGRFHTDPHPGQRAGARGRPAGADRLRRHRPARRPPAGVDAGDAGRRAPARRRAAAVGRAGGGHPAPPLRRRPAGAGPGPVHGQAPGRRRRSRRGHVQRPAPAVLRLRDQPAARIAAECARAGLTPASLEELARQELGSLALLLRRAPRQLDRIATIVQPGNLQARVRLFADEEDVRVVTRLLNRVVLAGLGGLVGVLSVMLLGTQGGPPFTGDTSLFQFFGYFGLFCATVLILRVIVAILRDGLN